MHIHTIHGLSRTKGSTAPPMQVELGDSFPLLWHEKGPLSDRFGKIRPLKPFLRPVTHSKWPNLPYPWRLVSSTNKDWLPQGETNRFLGKSESEFNSKYGICRSYSRTQSLIIVIIQYVTQRLDIGELTPPRHVVTYRQ